ncbi:MAG: CBS domain-containing protein [Actinomycetota bacterium]
MLARDLARPYPTVGLEDDALDAARLLAQRQLPGLLVVDGAGRPHTVLPGSQVLRFLVPGYVQDDPALARVYGERAAEEVCARLPGRPVRELLPRDRDEVPVVDDDATLLEVAAVMARVRSPLVAVVDREGRLLGGIVVSRLLSALLPT